jgi:outer membrane receptor protein involved in Fe transport
MRSLALLLTVFLAAGCALFGQSGLGSITGTIVDQSDAAIPGATIKLVQLSTNTERVTKTNEVGLFVMPSLVASRYTMTISAGGFQSRTIENIDVNAFQSLAMGRLKLDLSGGPITVVEVTADVQALSTESAVRNETVQSKQVTEMPLQGRNWSTLLKIIPGSTPRNVNAINGREAGYDGYGDFRVNGKASNQTQVNLDGGSNVDHGSDTKTTVTPSLESIQEVAVLTNNFQAEYGIRAGVVVNIVTKSGTNNWHGTAWNYMRNEAFNATPWDRAYFGFGKPRYRYNYYGGNLGGPIKKDKLFFFYNFEDLKQDTPTISQQIRVPTLLERQGDFSQTVNADGTRPTIYLPGTQASGAPQLLPGNVMPKSMINPLGTAILNIFPEPNLKNETNNNYLNQYSKEDRRYLNVAKVDWNINETTRVYGRISYDYQRYRDMVTWAAGSNLPFVITGWNRPDKAITGNLTKTFSPTMVTEVLVNWQKDFVNGPIDIMQDPSKIDPDKVGLGGLPLAFPVPVKVMPEISGTGYQDFQFNRYPWYAKAPETQIANTWTWTRGSHIIKWGGQYILNKKDEVDSSIYKGSFNFGVNTASEFDWGYSPANVLAGAVSQFRQVSNSARKLSKYQDLHFFIQDTWKVTPKLTLDYGLRFYHIPTEFNTQPKVTLDAVLVPGKWDPAKAPRYYVVNPKNTRTLIDPAYPDNPLPANVFSALLYSLVPGSGDPLNGVVPLGSEYNAGVRDPNFLLFAPRGGFAWQFLDKTVLRGGFGWSYNRPTIGQAINTFENGLAGQVDYRQTSLTTLTTSTVKRLSPRNSGALDESSNQVPTVYDFSLSIQRELPFGMLFDVAYIGNVQRHQTMNFNINQVLPGTSGRPEFIDPRLAGNNFAGPVSASNPGPLAGTQSVDSNLMRPFRGFGNLNLITNVANARYNSLQVNMNKRFSHGLTAQFSWTYGKLLTQTESQGPFYYRWKDYTGFMANNDRNHVVGFNYTYDVPSLSRKLGWQSRVWSYVFDNWGIAHMMNFYTGQPLTPGISLQYANNTQGVANVNAIFTGTPDFGPRLSPTANPNTGTDDIARAYNIDPFLLPGIPGDGTGSRNYLYSPGTFSNDINVSKDFRIHERYRLELRGSFFNPFNQVRRQDLNTTHQFKMKGATLANGYYLFNSPDQLVKNLVERNPNANEAEKYNQYRSGVGHKTLTSVLDMRRIEIGLRFLF